MIRLVEVGPRDGLQSETRSIPVEAKVAYVDALSATGIKEIEAGAFVSPKAIPQMAGSEEVFRKIKRAKGVVYSALVPNETGLDRALAAKAGKIAVFTAASETFNKKNINATIAESLARFKPVVSRAKTAKLPVRGYISTAFHCPYEGPIAPRKVLAVAEEVLALGVDELSIGDTIGKASPMEVRALLELLLKKVPKQRVFLHFHDTYGMAVANALTAYEGYGITGFDSSAGGVGGCPYAPGASGNVATEDLLYALKASGAAIPAEPEAVAKAAASLPKALGRPLASRLSMIKTLIVVSLLGLAGAARAESTGTVKTAGDAEFQQAWKSAQDSYHALIKGLEDKLKTARDSFDASRKSAEEQGRSVRERFEQDRAGVQKQIAQAHRDFDAQLDSLLAKYHPERKDAFDKRAELDQKYDAQMLELREQELKDETALGEKYQQERKALYDSYQAKRKALQDQRKSDLQGSGKKK